MTSQNYKDVLDSAMARYGELIIQRENTEVEIKKIRQFVSATIHMLSDEDQQAFWERIAQTSSTFDVRESSLIEAIRDILCRSPKHWFTVAQVRDSLRASGFDFSGYSTNPLASVSTTLKRLSAKEAETTEVDGVTAYRWKSVKAAKARLAKKSLETLYGDLFSQLARNPLRGAVGGLMSARNDQNAPDAIAPETEIGDGESIDRPEK
jgi:hypothetical protein